MFSAMSIYMAECKCRRAALEYDDVTLYILTHFDVSYLHVCFFISIYCITVFQSPMVMTATGSFFVQWNLKKQQLPPQS